MGEEAIGKMPSSTTAFTRSSSVMLKPASSFTSSEADPTATRVLMAAATSLVLTISPRIFTTSYFGALGREVVVASLDRS